MTRLVIIVFYALLFASCNVTKPIEMREGYFIYSSNQKIESKFWSRLFYVRSHDTLIECREQFGYRDSLIDHGVKYIDLVQSKVPYYVKKRGNSIYYNYKQNHDRTDTVLRYSLNKNDTVRFVITGKGEKIYSDHEGISQSVYLKDTVIKFYNHRIPCWIFREEPMIKPKGRDYVIYTCISKNGFIPWQKSIHEYDNDNNFLSASTNIVRAILDTSEVKSLEYTYPSYYFSSDDGK